MAGVPLRRGHLNSTLKAEKEQSYKELEKECSGKRKQQVQRPRGRNELGVWEEERQASMQRGHRGEGVGGQ